MKYEQEYRRDHPQSEGETDKNFDRLNYIEWIDRKYETLIKMASSSSLIIDRIPTEMSKDVHHVNTHNSYSEEYRKGYNEADRNMNVIIKQIKNEESI